MTDLLRAPISNTYFSQRLRLHYVDWGNPEAPPLVLIHGGRDHCRNWDWVAQALRDDFHIVAPDLRGHGDSQQMVGSGYAMIDHVYDLAQLLRQQQLEPVSLIGHSRGAGIALQFAGIYPEKISKLIAIEGMGPPTSEIGARARTPAHERMQKWITGIHEMAGRFPKRYPSLDAAIARMQQANPRLTDEQARHLTVHGTNQNEDGSYAWKFDNYVYASSPYPFNEEDADEIWSRVTVPTLLVGGLESAGDPANDPRVAHFPNAKTLGVANAGHWVHHDQLDLFLEQARAFLQGD